MKVTLDLSEYMLPKFYQTHFQRQLSRSQFLVLEIVLNLLSSEKQVRLERLARVFPYPITTESRRRKLQRFLDLPQLTLTCLWFPLITYWLTTYCQPGQKLSIAIDLRQWGTINLFMVSLIWERRAIPDGVTTPLKHRLNQGHSSHTPLKKWQFIRSCFH